MKEFVIKGKRKLCFIVKLGALNDIVVTYDSLAPVDLKRFLEMEKQGGDLMRVMRDTTLDNGVNALNMYEALLITVPILIDGKVDSDEPNIAPVKEVRETVKKKRGPGRPRKKS